MKITCWGARGSIPVSGAEYVKYGGDTTCIEIRSSRDDTIIIDAGSGIRRLGNKLLAANQRTVSMIFTHAHWDHLLGFPFFKPIYLQGTAISMYGCPFAQESIMHIVAKSMEAPYFPVDFSVLQARISSHLVCDEAFEIGPVRVTPIHLNHPNQGLGFRFEENGKSFVFLTDNELTHAHAGGRQYEDYVRFSEGADLLIHDAEYTADQYRLTKGWGHSVYTDALRLAREAKVGRFGLFHHNQERSDTDLDRIVEECRSIAASASDGPDCFAAAAGMEIAL